MKLPKALLRKFLGKSFGTVVSMVSVFWREHTKTYLLKKCYKLCSQNVDILTRKTWIFSAYGIYFKYIMLASKAKQSNKEFVIYTFRITTQRTSIQSELKNYYFFRNYSRILEKSSFSFVLECKLIYSVIKRKAKSWVWFWLCRARIFFFLITDS